MTTIVKREEITRLRFLRRMTRQKLAMLADVTVETVRRIEIGESSPRPGTVGRIADALGVSVKDLLLEPDEEALPQAEPETVQ